MYLLAGLIIDCADEYRRCSKTDKHKPQAPWILGLKQADLDPCSYSLENFVDGETETDEGQRRPDPAHERPARSHYGSFDRKIGTFTRQVPPCMCLDLFHVFEFLPSSVNSRESGACTNRRDARDYSLQEQSNFATGENQVRMREKTALQAVKPCAF